MYESEHLKTVRAIAADMIDAIRDRENELLDEINELKVKINKLEHRLASIE